MSENRINPILLLLQNTDIFRDIPGPVLLESVPQLNVFHFKPGEFIIRKGEAGDSMFIIMSGEVKVHDEEVTVAKLNTGSYFGEMSLLQTLPRSMSVSASTPVELISISQSAFYAILKNYPELIQKVISELSDRLRNQNSLIVEEFKSREDELKRQVDIQTALYKEQKERAEQGEKFKEQFLANMSHEIRTPMNAVMGMTNLVLDTPLTERQKYYLRGIKNASENLLRILNDILDLSKINAGKMELEKIDFSIRELLGQVKQTLQHKADEKNIHFHLEVDPKIPDVLMDDPVRLNQILINLAGNAIKFTEKGSVTISLSLESTRGAVHRIIFSVADTGVGIPASKLETIFESFSQANASDTRKFGGTGLGLSISRQLVELHNSSITVQSGEGKGTTFSFIFEMPEGSAAKLKEQHSPEQELDGSILDGLRILITDDDEYNRVVARDSLESKAKLEVVTANDGFEAIDLLKRQTFDLVLMDVQMPGMNGFETTRYIRNQFAPPVCNIPVVALTASVLGTDLDKCTEAGMNAWIPKPFKVSDLILGIASVMNIQPRTKSRANITSGNSETLSGQVTQLDYLKKFCEGDPVRMKKYVRMFLDSATGYLEKIKTALSENNFAELATQVHAYKTKWVMMGMNSTRDLAVSIEKNCRENGNPEEIRRDTEAMISECKQAIVELSPFGSDNIS